ncbi:MAG TPA: site-specific integrase [Puia sp.]|jgi:integrase|nr:site-specific integrase [Puia sp.]
MKRLKVNFYLKADKARNGLCPIYGKIILGATNATFSTSRYISKERWQITNRLLSSLRINNEISLKNFIYDIPRQVDDAYTQMMRSTESNAQITASQLRDTFWRKPKPKKEISIIDIMELYVSDFKLKMDKRERAVGSYEKYVRMVSVVREFLEKKHNQSDMSFSEVNSDFIFGLDYYLRNERPNGGKWGIGHNTTVKYIRNISVMINYSIKRGKIVSNPFNIYDETLNEVPTIYLTQAELEKIENKEFGTSRLDLVRDIFLFSCYTSYAPVDAMKLTWDNIIEDGRGCIWIVAKRQKNKVDSNIPLLTPAERLINKYKNDPRCDETNRLLPRLSNSNMNAYLKEIADLCGISKNLTWYVSRHTFGTTVTLAKGVPIETVSKAMGHKRILQTQHYAKILDESVRRDMAILNEKYR